MSLDPKILIVAGVAALAWYVLRQKPAAASATASAVQPTTSGALGSIWDGLGLGTGNTAATSIGATVATPMPKLDTTPAPAAPVAAWGGSSSTPAAPFTSSVDASGLRTYADGSTHQMNENEMHVYNLQKNGWNGLPY